MMKPTRVKWALMSFALALIAVVGSTPLKVVAQSENKKSQDPLTAPTRAGLDYAREYNRARIQRLQREAAEKAKELAEKRREANETIAQSLLDSVTSDVCSTFIHDTLQITEDKDSKEYSNCKDSRDIQGPAGFFIDASGYSHGTWHIFVKDTQGNRYVCRMQEIWLITYHDTDKNVWKELGSKDPGAVPCGDSADKCFSINTLNITPDCVERK